MGIVVGIFTSQVAGLLLTGSVSVFDSPRGAIADTYAERRNTWKLEMGGGYFRFGVPSSDMGSEQSPHTARSNHKGLRIG